MIWDLKWSLLVLFSHTSFDRLTSNAITTKWMLFWVHKASLQIFMHFLYFKKKDILHCLTNETFIMITYKSEMAVCLIVTNDCVHFSNKTLSWTLSYYFNTCENLITNCYFIWENKLLFNVRMAYVSQFHYA